MIAAVRRRLHPPCLAAGAHGNGLMQLSADVVQPYAVLGRVPGRELAVGYVLAIDIAAGLVVERVMNPVAAANTSITASMADGESPVAVGMKQTRFFPSAAESVTAYSSNAGSRFSPGGRFTIPEKAKTCLGLTDTWKA